MAIRALGEALGFMAMIAGPLWLAWVTVGKRLR